MTSVQRERIKNWISALRGGQYQQTTGALRTQEGFCCLGVACDLYAKEAGKDGKWTGYNVFTFCIPDDEDLPITENETLPAPVVDWYGLPSEDPEDFTTCKTLAELNDGGYTFPQIAQIIENNFLREDLP